MFRVGDVLLYTAPAWKFSNIIPKIIRLITGNKITHVSLIISINPEDYIILDALVNGVKLKTMTEAELYSRRDDFELYGIARLENEPEFGNNELFKVASEFHRKDYGFLTIINLLIQHGKTRLFPKKKWSIFFKSYKAYICSEVTQLVYEKLNYKFEREACLTEPDDYIKSPWKIIEL